MTTATAEEILNYVCKWIDTTGWVEQSVTLEGHRCAVVRFTFADAKPRKFKLFSPDLFKTLRGVAIYEVRDESADAFERRQPRWRSFIRVLARLFRGDALG